MIKISLSTEIEEKHLKYCKENILPGIENWEPFPVDKNEFVLPTSFDIHTFKEEEKKFWDYIIENFEAISIGKPEVLKEHDNEIKKKFAIVIKCIRILKPKENKNKSFSQFLLKYFQYDQFEIDDLFDILLKKAKKRTNKSRYSPEIEKLMIEDLLRCLPNKKQKIYDSFFENDKIKELNSPEFREQFKEIEVVLTMDNFNHVLDSVDVWSDYAFVMESGIRVCPYCNRQYITPVFSATGKLRGEIDHFLPKSVYPYFSMSLYNMIPVCHTCNQIKGAKDFDFESINPYQESLNDHFIFEVNPVSQDLSIKLGEAKKEAIKKHVDTYKLKPLYAYHNNQAIELLKKRHMYPDAYIRDLFSKYKADFSSIEDLKEFIFGYISDENQLNDEAFLKLRRDVAKQLNFLPEPAEDEQIIKLKKIAEKM